MERKNLIVELDPAATPAEAVDLVLKLIPHVDGFKIGLKFIASMLVQLVLTNGDEEANFKLKKVRTLFWVLQGKVLWDSIPGDMSEILNELDIQTLSWYVPGDETIRVIGRPITAAPDPVEAAKKFAAEIAEVLNSNHQQKEA